MQENQTVENFMQDTGLDDAVFSAPVNQEPTGESLESVLGAQQEEPKAEPQQEPKPQGKQAGWIQQRIQEGIAKQLQPALERQRSELSAQFAAENEAKLKPLYESMLNREAAELVREGEFKTQERALEYLRLKNGLPQTQEPTPQPARNDKGQFAPQQNDADSYGQTLIAQVKAIEALGGPDVMEAYNTNPDIKQKILSREWDFTDVAKHLSRQEPATQVPTPARRPNGGGPAARTVSELTSEQFAKMQKYLERGGTIDMRQK